MTQIKDAMIENKYDIATVYKDDGRVSFAICNRYPSPEDESVFTGDKSVAGYSLIRDKGLHPFNTWQSVRLHHVLEQEGDGADQRWHRVAGAKLKNNSFYKETKSEYMLYRTLQQIKDEAKREGYAGFDIL